jgi:hypothetical protein
VGAWVEDTKESEFTAMESEFSARGGEIKSGEVKGMGRNGTGASHV